MPRSRGTATESTRTLLRPQSSPTQRLLRCEIGSVKLWAVYLQPESLAPFTQLVFGFVHRHVGVPDPVQQQGIAPYVVQVMVVPEHIPSQLKVASSEGFPPLANTAAAPVSAANPESRSVFERSLGFRFGIVDSLRNCAVIQIGMRKRLSEGQVLRDVRVCLDALLLEPSIRNSSRRFSRTFCTDHRLAWRVPATAAVHLV